MTTDPKARGILDWFDRLPTERVYQSRWEPKILTHEELSQILTDFKKVAERLKVNDGELWSAIRTLLEQGASIQQDYQAGNHKGYEEYSARLDEAARERLEWLKTKDPAFNLACELQEKFDKLLKELVVLQAYHAQAGITYPEELKEFVRLVSWLVGGGQYYINRGDEIRNSLARLTGKE